VVTFRAASIDVSTWRPQLFGRGNVRNVKDPLIEPLWDGERVLLVVGESVLGPPEADADEAGQAEPEEAGQAEPDTRPDGVRAAFFDLDGEELVGPALDLIVGELGDAARADVLVLDGYLSRQPTSPAQTSRDIVKTPTATQFMGQMFFGRRSSRAPRAPTASGYADTTDPSVPIAFVAVDLLAIDEQALLEIPLLERKRILETAFEETQLLRRSPYVRPPVDSWLIAWRALGFHELAYKSANSHYLPGRQNEDWSRIRIPID